MHQYYCKLGGQPELKILDNEAVCALIPLVEEPSIGLDLAPVRQIGESNTFHFDPDAEPKYRFLKRIGYKDPREVHAGRYTRMKPRSPARVGFPLPARRSFLSRSRRSTGYY